MREDAAIHVQGLSADIAGGLGGEKDGERLSDQLVVLSEGSHAISHEKNRMHLIREVQHFLEEPAR